MSPSRRVRVTRGGASLLVVWSLAACSSGTAAAGGGKGIPAATLSGFTYRVPAFVHPGRPGDVIATSDLGPDSHVGGADRRVVVYQSTSVTGRDIAVSGVVLVPPGRAPRGGWPVVSWAHGTTGMADRCAPSEMPNLHYNEYAQEARAFVAAGYALAATDYPGLGTPGVPSYLVGVDEGNSVVDVVTAAHHLLAHLAPTWFAVGHSQGGQAVLFATRAAARAPGLHLGGAIAIAPASALDLILPAVINGGDRFDLSYAVYSVIGLSGVDPHIDLSSLLGPAGRTRLPLILRGACLERTDASFAGVAPSEIFRIGPQQLGQLDAELGHYDNPDNTPTAGPILVIQGSTDQDVPAAVTQLLVQHLQQLGSDVTERVYPGLNHDQVLGPSSCDQLAWLATHGGTRVASCVPQPTDQS
jgi:alpha-beta hydrolase superfamily lysophospholipase